MPSFFWPHVIYRWSSQLGFLLDCLVGAMVLPVEPSGSPGARHISLSAGQWPSAADSPDTTMYFTGPKTEPKLFKKKVRERWDPKKVHDMLTHLHTSQPIWIRSAGLPLHLSKWVRGRDGKGLQASADYCTGMIRIIYPWASGMEHRFGAQISLKYVRC